MTPHFSHLFRASIVITAMLASQLATPQQNPPQTQVKPATVADVPAIAKAYRSSKPDWAQQLNQDADAILLGVQALKVSNPDGSIGYLYANMDGPTGFGWMARRIQHTGATNGWMILMLLNFNPFVPGGGSGG